MKSKTVGKPPKSRNSGLIMIVLLLLLGLVVGGCYYGYKEFLSPKSSTIQTVAKIDDYAYYLNSNATRLYKKYYKLLEKELEDSKVDEEKYVTLISQLFAIDFYTLDNKITNQDIGGVQFIAATLQERFKEEASQSIYKYIQNNMRKKRTQELPEVKKATVTNVKREKYEKGNFRDFSAFTTTVELEYIEDMGYPEELKLHFVHEENKLVLVEIKENKENA
ncbi:MAG: hypothetical protein HFG40_01040 [Bacilli bacterium]|nr:hypothetical protein [Bacilli bacterium]